jgi:hypothetical protein
LRVVEPDEIGEFYRTKIRENRYQQRQTSTLRKHGIACKSSASPQDERATRREKQREDAPKCTTRIQCGHSVHRAEDS